MLTDPLLLLHGALGSPSQLDPLKKLLERQGRSVFTLEFSGHSGKKFESTFGIETFANEILAFAEVNKISKLDIFGYSMGGYAALWAALLSPQRIGNVVTLGTKFDWSPDSAEKEIRKMDATKIIEKIPAYARILEHRHAPNDWKILLAKTAEMMKGLGEKPLLTLDNVRSIKSRVSVCLGDKDDMADAGFSKKIAEAIPDCQFVTLPDTPHPIEKVSLVLLTPYLL